MAFLIAVAALFVAYRLSRIRDWTDIGAALGMTGLVVSGILRAPWRRGWVEGHPNVNRLAVTAVTAGLVVMAFSGVAAR